VLVLHGLWDDGRLWLWAEDSGLRPGRPGRRSAAARPHPYAAGTASLVETLGDAVADVVRKGTEGELVLALPSTTAGPVPSPSLAEPATEPAKTTQRTLASWRVPATAFRPDQAIELLSSLTGAEDLVLGSSFRQLSAVAELAADLVGRGRVLPALVTEAGPEDHAARWRPVVLAGDAARARALATTLPPIAKAIVTKQAAVSGAELVVDALDALTDATVRARLEASGARLLPVRRARSEWTRIPLAERWVEALAGSAAIALDPTEPEDQREFSRLTDALDAWWTEAAALAGPHRVSFRLLEPDPESEQAEPPWRVELALQSSEDPSLILRAVDLWAGETAGIADPEEELLAGLGRAARIYPELRDELRAPEPTGVSTDATGAYRFVTEVAPALLAAGFGVLLPSWLGRTRPALKLTTRSTTANPAGGSRPAGMSQDELVEFRFDLALGDDVLDEAELAELARLKAPLVRVRGRWVELDHGRLRKVLELLERRGSGTMTASEALRLAVRGLDEPGEPLPITQVEADGWLGDLLSGAADRRLAPMTTPVGFAGDLRPYQERGLSWLAFLGGLGLGGVLADDMGLGKTVQLLALLVSERTEHRPKPTLLVCPMSLVGNWQREAERFASGLRVHVHHGGDRLAGDELADALASADLVLTTYALVDRDREALAGVEWQRVVCDEAQYIKNSATKAAKAVRALPAAGRIALTGTPVENHLGELWSILDFVNPGLLGTATSFRRSFAVPIERHGDAEAAAALKRATAPFVLRRLKTDRTIIADLPAKQEMTVWCNLTAEQASLYQATVDDMLDRIANSEGMERRGLVLATMARLKQVCNHPAHLLGDGSRLAGRSGKLARLEEILAEVVAEGEKALCFTQYAEFGTMLEPYLTARLGVPVSFLHGGVAKKSRDAMVARFQETQGPAVFLLSLKAGGTGLNLTAANHVVHVDRWWNPAVEDQATDRAYRIGQRKNVQVRKFVCVGTMEEQIDKMIAGKKALAERVVGTGEGWLTELSVAELRDLITLSPDAVSE
jgi:SNF2 family DNA or RNA helicase